MRSRQTVDDGVVYRHVGVQDPGIVGIVGEPAGDVLNIAPADFSRLKRRKLKLKDQIAQVEDRLLPDIIA